MEKIIKTQIKTFKCISPIVFHWGVQLEEGEICDVIGGGKKTGEIIFDLISYNQESPSMPEFTHLYKDNPEKLKELKKKWDEYHKIDKMIRDKYSIEIEYNWLKLKGRDNLNEFTFILESEDEIKEKYGIFSECKIHFENSVNYFSEYFDKSQLNRAIAIDDLIS
jgi:hypothetical protein